MANNYLQFCHYWEVTEEEAEWFKSNLHNPPLDIKEVIAEEADYAFRGVKLSEVTNWEDLWSFSWTFRAADPQSGNLDFGIYTEESGNAYQAALLIQRFLRRHRPDEVWGISFAEYSMPMQVREFSGGAIRISAHSLVGMNAQNWLEEQGAKY